MNIFGPTLAVLLIGTLVRVLIERTSRKLKQQRRMAAYDKLNRDQFPFLYPDKQP